MWPYDENEMQWLSRSGCPEAEAADKPLPGEEFIPC
jgi:hypothetical protein